MYFAGPLEDWGISVDFLRIKKALFDIIIQKLYGEENSVCTAATYKTKDFYFGRTLDHGCSYSEEVTITPRNFPLPFRSVPAMPSIWMPTTRS